MSETTTDLRAQRERDWRVAAQGALARAERAEAALDRVRALVEEWDIPMPVHGGAYAPIGVRAALHAAIDGPDARHHD